MFQCSFGRNGEPTRDPWIDAGIVGLFDYVKDRVDLQKKHGVTVDLDAFALSAHNSSKVEEFLRDAFEEVKKVRYIKETGKQSLIYDQAQDKLVPTKKITLVPIIAGLFVGGNLRPEYDKVPFPEHLRPQLEEIQKRHDKAVDTKTIKKGKIFASAPNFPWEIRPSLAPTEKTRKKGKAATRQGSTTEQCAFCEREHPASALHSNNYPFIVATKNWSNFFSQQRLELKMCSLCEIAALFAFNCIFFNVANKNKSQIIFLAIPHAESLSEISTFWIDIRGAIRERTLENLSNIFDDGFKYSYLHETVLGFAHHLYDSFSKARNAAQLCGEAETKSWHFYLGKKVGNVLQFNEYVLFDEMERLFRLFEEMTKTMSIEQQKGMFDSLSIKEGNNWNNVYREAIAKAILRNRPLTEVAESFLYAKGTTVRGFTEFIKLYHTFRLGGLENEQ
jgi:hypothetical protein